MEQTEKFDSWAIVEVMGHARFAGRVTEQALGGTSFVRVDVPEVDGSPAFTKLFGASAIYSITPVTEDLARRAVKACHSEPVSVYIPPDRRLSAGADPAKPATIDPENAHDCIHCYSPCDCGDPEECDGCSACAKDELEP